MTTREKLDAVYALWESESADKSKDKCTIQLREYWNDGSRKTFDAACNRINAFPQAVSLLRELEARINVMGEALEEIRSRANDSVNHHGRLQKENLLLTFVTLDTFARNALAAADLDKEWEGQHDKR